MPIASGRLLKISPAGPVGVWAVGYRTGGSDRPAASWSPFVIYKPPRGDWVVKYIGTALPATDWVKFTAGCRNALDPAGTIYIACRYLTGGSTSSANGGAIFAAKSDDYGATWAYWSASPTISGDSREPSAIMSDGAGRIALGVGGSDSQNLGHLYSGSGGALALSTLTNFSGVAASWDAIFLPAAKSPLAANTILIPGRGTFAERGIRASVDGGASFTNYPVNLELAGISAIVWDGEKIIVSAAATSNAEAIVTSDLSSFTRQTVTGSKAGAFGTAIAAQRAGRWLLSSGWVNIGAAPLTSKTVDGGATWSTTAQPSTRRIKRMVWNGLKYYASTGSNILLESSDGITWDQVTIPSISGTLFVEAVFGEDPLL